MPDDILNNYVPLARGGVLIPTSIGHIQFGIPPETIKDTMQTPGGVPQVYVLPQFMFDLSRGIAMAELEFPLYFNFFVLKKKTRIICSDAQQERIVAVMSEALFGPDKIDIADEFIDGAETPGFPDLQAELNYFRKKPGSDRLMKLTDFIEFFVLDKKGRVKVENIEIHLDRNYDLTVYDQGKKITHINRETRIMPELKYIRQEVDMGFTPPLFGITTLGSGHGFDPHANTSGMIIWINRRGIIIDPPVYSSDNLLRLGVSPKMVDSVILTHCHADHDAGTLQKLLLEGRLNIFTTRTIFQSFMRKSSSLTGIEEGRLQKIVQFFPVTIGKPININGGEFIFNYTLHSIPTIGIQVNAFSRSMVYSSDTLNDPGYIDRLQADGVLSQDRHDDLLNFPWHCDVVIHEAGQPPLHTPLDYLCTLPEKVRQRIYLVHVTQSSIPDDSGLRIAPTGLSNTLTLVDHILPHEDAIEIIDVLAQISLFQDLPVNKIREFLIIVQQESFKAGQTICKEGQQVETFYIIIRGSVDIIARGKKVTTLGDCDYFGEKTVFLDQKRTTDAVARSNVKLLSVRRDDMLSFVRGTSAEKKLQHIATFQNEELRYVFNKNRQLRKLSAAQQTQLHSHTVPIPGVCRPGIKIYSGGKPQGSCFIIKQGQVAVLRNNKQINVLGRGDLIGIKDIFVKGSLKGFSFRALDEVKLYSIDRQIMEDFLDQNPGLYIKFFHYQY